MYANTEAKKNGMDDFDTSSKLALRSAGSSLSAVVLLIFNLRKEMNIVITPTAA
ncbi:hypothetical protein D9M69_689920 [compost metagenome]